MYLKFNSYFLKDRICNVLLKAYKYNPNQKSRTKEVVIAQLSVTIFQSFSLAIVSLEGQYLDYKRKGKKLNSEHGFLNEILLQIRNDCILFKHFCVGRSKIITAELEKKPYDIYFGKES